MFKIKLVHDWKRVLLIGYSTWAAILALAGMVVPQLAWQWFGVALNPVFFGWSVTAVLFIGIVGRIIDQPSEGRWGRRLVVVALALLFISQAVPANSMDTVNEGLVAPAAQQTLSELVAVKSDEEFNAVTFGLVSRWEGKRNYAYFDIVGVPTICYGHTRTVTAEDVRNKRFMSDAQCRDLLIAEIAEYREQVHRHFTDDTLAHRLPVRRDAAFTSLTINIGWGAAGRSTAVRRLNNGDVLGSCEALTWFNRAGGVRVTGLVNRRNEEYAYCIVDL